jgi:hypothetical protein
MSRSLKEIIDYSTFTDPKTSQDLYSNSIRRGFEFDSYGDRDTFQAVVITNPIPTDPQQINLFIGGEVSGSQRVSQFTYRARIVGVNSPHQFLPDPCNSTYANDPVQAEKLIAMHTLFVSKEEDGAGRTLPVKGSLVEVKLNKNTFSYNLQVGEHLKVVSKPQTPSSNNNECDSLQSIFNNAGASSLSGFYSGENLGGPENVDDLYNYWQTTYPAAASLLPPEGQCGGIGGYDIVTCKTGMIGTVSVTLHPDFWDKVKEVYDKVKAKRFNESFDGGGGLRSVRTQMALRIQNATQPYDYETLLTRGSYDPPTARIPTAPGTQGSRHMYGLAIDFGGILLSGGTRVAKLEGSVARNSKTYRYMLTLEENGFKNYGAEPWHWSIDGY